MMLTVEQYLMGRFDGMTEALWANARATVLRLNWLQFEYRIDYPDAPWWELSSGRRTPEGNAAIQGAAPQSKHLTCEAGDILDRDRRIARWCAANLHSLYDRDLWMEDPRATPTWVHLQTVPPGSGLRVFIPNADWARRLAGQPLTDQSIVTLGRSS